MNATKTAPERRDSRLFGVLQRVGRSFMLPIALLPIAGLLLGVGVGLILRHGGCLDGTEIVAMLLSQHTEFSVGQIVLFFNIIIYGVAGLLFGPDRALYPRRYCPEYGG